MMGSRRSAVLLVVVVYVVCQVVSGCSGGKEKSLPFDERSPDAVYASLLVGRRLWMPPRPRAGAFPGSITRTCCPSRVRVALVSAVLWRLGFRRRSIGPWRRPTGAGPVPARTGPGRATRSSRPSPRSSGRTTFTSRRRRAWVTGCFLGTLRPRGLRRCPGGLAGDVHRDPGAAPGGLRVDERAARARWHHHDALRAGPAGPRRRRQGRPGAGSHHRG